MIKSHLEAVISTLILPVGMLAFILYDYVNHPSSFQDGWLKVLVICLVSVALLIFLSRWSDRMKLVVWIGSSVVFTAVHMFQTLRGSSQALELGFEMIFLVSGLLQLSINVANLKRQKVGEL